MNRRSFLKSVALTAASAEIAEAAIHQAALPVSPYKVVPACERKPASLFSLNGPIGRYLENVEENWLKVAPLSNPAMLEMFRDRDRRPLREMVPWAGEFAGKYLTSAVEVW